MNRLQRGLLWLRHAWWFHWAHKPLCGAYRGDVLRVGPMFVCRSCTAAWLGLVGSGAILVVTAPPPSLVVTLLAAAVAVVGPASHPAVYGRIGPRSVRDLLRAATGAIAALAVSLWFLGPVWYALVSCGALTVLFVAFAVARARRRLARCAPCPELGRGVCSGYARQAVSIRAFEQAWTARVLRSGGFAPDLRRRGRG